jgi:CheY-like chemotaxis protein
MDVHMPVIDGLEASRRIQAQFPEHERPKIVALSADTTQVLLFLKQNLCRALLSLPDGTLQGLLQQLSRAHSALFSCSVPSSFQRSITSEI